MAWHIDSIPSLAFGTASDAGVAPALPAPPTTAAGSLQAGAVERRQLDADPGLAYFVYRARSAGAGAPMLVTVHGISRNAREHVRLFAPLAERDGVVIVSPLFDAERFPAYQRLGRNANREDPAELLERVVADAARLTGADARQLHLFGYSGGGQFVHRYVLAHPQRAAAYVIGAAGWYTFPDPARRYPHGLRRNRRFGALRLEPEEFLAVPGCVLVGERDVHSGTALRSTERLTQEQGASRVERGARWVEAMNAAAARLGMPERLTFGTLPRSGHSFRRSMRRGGMGELVFQFLFETTATAGTLPPGVQRIDPRFAARDRGVNQ